MKDRFKEARKIVPKIFRWQEAPGTSYQGFMKMLAKWHEMLMGAIIPHVRARMKQMRPKQWEIAGYVVFAGDDS